MRILQLHGTLRRLRRDTSGAALVEFAILLPILLVLFGTVVESARTFWTYQTTIAGVRDAARYLARWAPGDACTGGGGLDGYEAELLGIVRNSLDGASVFPADVSIDSLDASCAAASTASASVARVGATMTIQRPFGPIFALAGGGLEATTTTVWAESRVFGQ